MARIRNVPLFKARAVITNLMVRVERFELPFHGPKPRVIDLAIRHSDEDRLPYPVQGILRIIAMRGYTSPKSLWLWRAGYVSNIQQVDEDCESTSFTHLRAVKWPRVMSADSGPLRFR